MDSSIERIDLMNYWNVVVRRRWVIALSVISFALLFLIAAFLTTPMYRAGTTLQIERQNPEILNMRDVASTDYAWSAYNDFYQTQFKVIASRPVARLAVERLNLLSHPDFAAADSEPGLRQRLLAMIPRKRGVSVTQDPLDRAAAQVQASLTVSPVRNSQLVNIAWSHSDPEFAARVANGIANAYILFSIESRFSTTDQAREFLLNQIGTLKREIQSIETRLQEYGEAKRIYSIDESNNLTLRALQGISTDSTQAQSAVANAEARYRAVVDTDDQALPQVVGSTHIAQLRSDQVALAAEYAEKSKLFKDGWPELQQLKTKLDETREQLRAEIERVATESRRSARAELDEATKRAANLESLLGTHEQAALRMKRDAVEYSNLQSEVGKKRETLDALLRRQNEMALSTRLIDMNSSSSNIRVMEVAQAPTRPYQPSTKLNLLLGILIGLGFGALAAFVLEQLDNTLSSPDELGALLSLPLLAVIPRHVGGGAPLARARRRVTTEAGNIDLIAHRDGRAGVSEAYRSLRTAILLSHAGHPPRRIAITSAQPEDGKTATALNLGVVLSQLGRRVLLVDADLRRPRLHQAFGTDAERGLSTHLSGLEDDPLKLVQRTDVENLDLLPSGPIPPNPSELLNSTIFASLGQRLIERGYDHVIFDTPPVLSVSDPLIVASVVDTGILVVRAGKTPRPSVRLAAARIAQSRIESFAAVFNDFDAEANGAEYGRYHSYYGRYEHDDADAPGEAKAHRAGGRGA